ncbi:MAG: hypothetical protein WC471_03730 [Candidatus Woesearchaeota archaeon]
MRIDQPNAIVVCYRFVTPFEPGIPGFYRILEFHLGGHKMTIAELLFGMVRRGDKYFDLSGHRPWDSKSLFTPQQRAFMKVESPCTHVFSWEVFCLKCIEEKHLLSRQLEEGDNRRRSMLEDEYNHHRYIGEGALYIEEGD